MTLTNSFGRTLRPLAVGGAVLGLVGRTAVPRPANALDAGAAVGIGLGGLALGTALGAASNPYQNPYYSNPYGDSRYPYGQNGAPAPAYTATPGYYPPAAYYQPRNCWDAYSRRYYAC